MCILTFSAGFKSAGHHYRIYSNKRRPRLSAASGTKKLISAAPGGGEATIRLAPHPGMKRKIKILLIASRYKNTSPLLSNGEA